MNITNLLKERSPEFGAFMREVAGSVNKYNGNWRTTGPKSARIGTSPLQELALEGYEFLPGSVKMGLGETGNSNGKTSHGGPVGSHGADYLVVMMQRKTQPNPVQVHVGTVAYVHGNIQEIKAHGHFIRPARLGYISIGYRLPEQPVSGFSSAGAVYMPTDALVTPQQFIRDVKAYRGRTPLRA